MWYSWSGTSQPEQDLPNTSARTQLSSSRAQDPCCFPTILDPSNVPDDDFLCSQHPSAAQASILWRSFLKNVHPLIKIFFDWEVEIVVEKTYRDSSSLSSGERALIFSIDFIAIYSLSEEECN